MLEWEREFALERSIVLPAYGKNLVRLKTDVVDQDCQGEAVVLHRSLKSSPDNGAYERVLPEVHLTRSMVEEFW